MTDRELMLEVLEALMYCEPDAEENSTGFRLWSDVMPILRERLAQPDTDKNQLEWQKLQTEHWKMIARDMMKKLQEQNGV